MKLYKSQKKLGEFLYKQNLEEAFLIMTKNPATKKEKIEFDYIKIKNFSQQNTINRAKRQIANWEKVFATYIIDRRLISLTCKNIF